MQVVQELFA